jgi:hypothetical protein
MMRKVLCSVACLGSLFVAAAAGGEKPAKKPAEPKVEPALAPDQAVLARLRGLGDNSSCVLKRARVIADGLGDFARGWHNMKKTGPTGRDYTIKMAWMPDRKRAFFCGANHQAPHRFNDAWEYDLASNTWVLLYAPDYNDCGAITDYDKRTLVLKDGWLRTRKGGPAHPGHTWWGLTYDPEARAAIWYSPWGGNRLWPKLGAVGAKHEELYKGPPMWAFYPYQRKWKPLPSKKPWPRKKYAASLEYIPELKGSLLQYGASSWLFNTEKKTWKDLSAKGRGLPPEAVVCRDPGRGLLIAHRGPMKDGKYRTWHSSLKGGKPDGWKKTLEAAAGLPPGHDAGTPMYFDPAGKVALLYARGSKTMWAYAPDQKKWTKLTPKGPPPPFRTGTAKNRNKFERIVAYLDPERNVFVVIGYDAVWCYRYKQKPAPAASKNQD